MSDPVSQYIVIIEWNGKKPSTSFYNRLREYGLVSRTPKPEGKDSASNTSLIAWRSSQGGWKKREDKRGVVLQEGTIVTNSETLAKEVATWAKDEDACSVMVGTMVVNDFSMSEEDMKAHQLLVASVSKRGPKAKRQHGTYCVTCLDEVKTFVVEAHEQPFSCPSCACSRIQVRRGQMPVVLDHEPSDRLNDFWWKTRFINGTFEIPAYSATGNSVFFGDVHSAIMIKSDGCSFGDAIKDWKFYLHLIDVAYCWGTLPTASKLARRLNSLNAYIASGGEYGFSFNPSDTPDILDLAGVESELLRYAEKA